MSKRKIECICGNCNNVCYRFKTEVNGSKSGKVFCSRSCAAQYNNKAAPKRTTIERTCWRCENTFKPINCKTRRRLCDKCQIDLKNSKSFKEMTVKEYLERDSVKGKHPSWKRSHVRSFNRSWNSDLTKLPCQRCNYSHHVELAHIKPVSSFDDNTLLSVINAPENILVLCPNCHWELDNGILDINSIPARTN